MNPGLTNEGGVPRSSQLVVPSDVDPIDAAGRVIGLRIGGAGNVTCRFVDDQVDAVYPNCPAGYYIHGRIVAVRATGTTATDIQALR